MRRFLAAAIAVLPILGACGGSSSETPFPQSSKEMPPDFAARRPKAAAPAVSSTPRPSPLPAPASSDDEGD